MRSRCRALAAACAAIIVLIGAPIGQAHVLLEGEAVQRRLVEIARLQREAREPSSGENRGEALYALGDRVQGLVDLLNQDLEAHGAGALLASLVARRLQELGLGVSRLEPTGRYAYDLAAFREYLREAPRGAHAADVRYRLLADGFYRTLALDAPALTREDPAGLVTAVAEAERFLTDFPGDDRTRAVRLFRATDYYRLARSTREGPEGRRYASLAREALREVMTLHPGTSEARTAEALLERLVAVPSP